jgi:hypothetical protein
MTLWRVGRAPQVTNESKLEYFAKGDGPGRYHSLYFKTGAWGREYRWNREPGAWETTTNLMDMLYKMELSLDQVTYEEAKHEFPEAFPLRFIEGEEK